MTGNIMNFGLLSDIELDRLIGALIRLPPEERTRSTEMMGKDASTEWEVRYPGTISPSVYDLAMSRGGFPSCYTGARSTVRLNAVEDQVKETTNE